MKIGYANYFVQNMGLGDPTTWVYKLIFDENDSNDTKIIHSFIMHGLVLCIKLNSCVAHMFYVWSFSHNTSVPIAINQKIYIISLHTYTTVFSWGDSNFNKNITS